MRLHHKTIIFVLAAFFSPATYSQSSIDTIAEKYRSSRQPASKETTDPVLTSTRKRVGNLLRRLYSQNLSVVILKNFYPQLKGIEQLIKSQSTTKQKGQILELQVAEIHLMKILTFTKKIKTGGTRTAGVAIAKLIKRFASRTDIYRLSKDTNTTPMADLKRDISNLEKPLAYRFSWAVNKLPEFRNPQGVRWTPNAEFQLGKQNRYFVRGFMKIQFAKEKPATNEEDSQKQAAFEESTSTR